MTPLSRLVPQPPPQRRKAVPGRLLVYSGVSAPEIPGGSGAERDASPKCSVFPFRAPRMPRGAYSPHHAAQPSRPGRISAGEADAAGKLQVPWCMATGSAVTLLRARAARGPGAIALVQTAALSGLRWSPAAGTGVRCPARPVGWASCSARSHRRPELLLPPSALVGAPAEAGRPCHRRPEERSQECRSPRDSPPPPPRPGLVGSGQTSGSTRT